MANTNSGLKENYQGVWDTSIGFGQKAALLSIDFLKGYVTEGSPLFAPGVVAAIPKAAQALKLARKADQLIIHTNILYQSDAFIDGGMWLKKAPVMKAMTSDNPLAEFCVEVAPEKQEITVSKQYASAFFGTSLSSTLVSQGVDTIVLTGCSTSGCIRATAVDGVQHGYRVIVIRDCVGDRHQAPHDANLFDINGKYGDVVSLKDYENYLRNSGETDL